jgi:hypothetical protein
VGLEPTDYSLKDAPPFSVLKDKKEMLKWKRNQSIKVLEGMIFSYQTLECEE